MIRMGLLTIVSSQCYIYKDSKTYLDSRQQTGYTRNKRRNKWNRDCITCLVENIQNCAGCVEYCVEYTRKFMAITDVPNLPIAITLRGMCVLG